MWFEEVLKGFDSTTFLGSDFASQRSPCHPKRFLYFTASREYTHVQQLFLKHFLINMKM